MKKGLVPSLRTAFLSGLVLLAPLAVTWVVFSWLVERIGGGFKPYFFFFVPEPIARHESLQFVWNVLATVLVCLLVTALGYFSRYVMGRYFGAAAERLINNIPGVSAVYNTVKQIVETFSSQNRSVFQRVVLVQFPREGLWSLGFLTGCAAGEAQERTEEEVWNVFVPTTPNPTTGFLIMLPRRDIVELEMSVGDGMKLIISGGTVTPPWPVAASTSTTTPNLTATPAPLAVANSSLAAATSQPATPPTSPAVPHAPDGD